MFRGSLVSVSTAAAAAVLVATAAIAALPGCASSTATTPPALPAAPAAAPPSAAPAAPAAGDPESIARDAVAKLRAHDFAGLAARFDDRMLAGLPVAKLEAVWKQVEDAAGAFDRIESASIKDVGSEPGGDGGGSAKVVSLTTRFQRAQLIFLISVDEHGKIAGLFVRPGDLAASWQPPPYAKLDAIEERSVSVAAARTLPGTLTLPRGKGPFPAVVLVHGSGPQDADETIGAIKVFKDLALGLASRGIAVLRYEKRTHADPTGVTTQKDEVDDAAHAAVALLKATPEIDARRIALLGHSQGGYLAPRIARADPAIRGLIILAGPTRPFEDTVIAQLKYLAAQDPSDDKLRQLLTEADKFRQLVQSPALKPGDTVALPTGGSVTGAYFLDVRGYRPEKVAAGLAIPIAVLQGERDYQVTMADDFAGWKAALGARKTCVFHSYPASNHAFVAGTGAMLPGEYAKPGHVEPQVIDDLAAWIGKLRG